MVTEMEVTDEEVIGYIVYAAVFIGYFTISLVPNPIHRRWKTISFFWETAKGGGPSNAYRWPWVVLNTEVIMGIQALRCMIQGAAFFGKTSVILTFMTIFFNVESRRQHVLYLLIAFVSVLSCTFTLQMMRMSYQMNYFLMTEGKKSREVKEKPQLQTMSTHQREMMALEEMLALADRETPPTTPRGGESNRESETISDEEKTQRSQMRRNLSDQELSLSDHEKQELEERVRAQIEAAMRRKKKEKLKSRRENEHILAHVVEDQLETQTQYDTQFQGLLKVESELTHDELVDRLQYIVQRQAMMFALSIRTLLFIIPLVLGLFRAEALTGGSVALILVLVYFDSLMG